MCTDANYELRELIDLLEDCDYTSKIVPPLPACEYFLRLREIIVENCPEKPIPLREIESGECEGTVWVEERYGLGEVRHKNAINGFDRETGNILTYEYRTYPAKDYNVRYRFWRYRPSKAECDASPWDKASSGI